MDPEDFQFETENEARNMLALADARWDIAIPRPEPNVTLATWDQGSILILGVGIVWVVLSLDGEYMVSREGEWVFTA